MGPIVQSALDRLHIILENSDVTLNMPDSWPSAYGHAGWVEEVWANYLSNAVKYGGKPPVISLGADDTHNGHVRFWVRDNGKGLTPEEQNQLFIEFSRLGEARAEGHGLGLSIVQRIITRLDGEVSVDSSPGEGSTFSFTLPTEGG
jgi:signal transduction histidine kinase